MNSGERFEILTSKDTDKWNDLIRGIPSNQRDIYFTPEYYTLYEDLGDGAAQCYVFRKNDKVLLYPFLLNSVNKLGYDLPDQYYDIQGAYGYNGVLTTDQSPDFISKAFKGFDNHCAKQNIIVEFLRINPLLPNPLASRSAFSLVYDRENVRVDLKNGFTESEEFEYSTMKNIRKAISSGLKCRFVYGSDISDKDLVDFIRIYHHTMERNNADKYYYFNNDYFQNIARKLGKSALFTFVGLNEHMIASELVLLGNSVAYSFLGGTLKEFYEYRPNDFLKAEVIRFLKNINLDFFLLGGGSEGVLRYKKSFSKNGIIPFYFGKRIHNVNVYNEVIRQWSDINPEKTDKFKSMVLCYRF